MPIERNTLFIANDVETSGPKLGVHSILSWGAALVTQEELTFRERSNRGLVFYTELKPDPHAAFDRESMKVGCSHLEVLKVLRREYPAYNPESSDFDPKLVLNLLADVGEDQAAAVSRFLDWVQRWKDNRPVVGVADTVFFDSGFINLLLGKHLHNQPSPYGHSGLDLDSFYRGYAKRGDANLKELMSDDRDKPHRADHDAVYLAQQARVLIYGHYWDLV